MTPEELEERYPDLPVMDCAGCGRPMVSPITCNEYFGKTPPDGLLVVGGRISGRPFCRGCLAPHTPPAGDGGPGEEPNPWQENAIRDLEGD